MSDAAAVGFIGLGNMGWPMAANVARAGFPLIVYDLDTARAEAFRAEHAALVGAGSEAFSSADVVVTMLPTGSVVSEVLLSGGVAAALPAGAVVVDMSSSPPAMTRELGRALAAHSVALVDAPVSGGVPKAIDGSLAIMLGADDEAAAQRAMPVLEAMSSRVLRTGGLGTGHAMKALNNFVSAAGFVAAAEALITGRKFGLDPAVIVNVLNASTGRNFTTETTVVSEVLSRRFAAQFTLGLFTKDLAIAAALADELDVEAPLCELVHDRIARAGEELGWGADYTAAVTVWEHRAGIELPAVMPG
jgi:3-hydroxyisobutyrate dehydrogenase